MTFTNVLDQITVGTSAPSRVSFLLPSSVNAVGGSVVYELLDATGVVYASGSASTYTITALPGTANQSITSEFNIVIPSTIPANVSGTRYQIRYTLTIGSNVYYNFDNVTLLPIVSTASGANEAVELAGDPAILTLVLPQTYNVVTLDVYQYNTKLTATPLAVGSPTSISDGYLYSGTLDTTVIPPALIPYTIMWNYNNTGGTVYREAGKLFLTTPSLIMATKDIEAVINRAHVGINSKPMYSTQDILTYLRLGADMFNASGHPTSFTMTNATGPIRALWLAFSQVAALRSQYLAEGNKAFDFSGQAISLNVDRTQYFESLASAIEQQVTEPVRQLKTVLSKRGLTAGDGNVVPTALAYGAIGSIGISLSPVSNVRFANGNAWLGGIRLF